jgi:hypothetical protein
MKHYEGGTSRGYRLLLAGSIIQGYGTVRHGGASRIAPNEGEVAFEWSKGDEHALSRWVIGSPLEVAEWAEVQPRVLARLAAALDAVSEDIEEKERSERSRLDKENERVESARQARMRTPPFGRGVQRRA